MLHRPSRGEPLSVWLITDEPASRDALASALKAEPHVAIAVDASTAHVALLDVGKSDDATRPRPHHDVFAPISTLDVPSVVLVDSESRAREAMARGARGAVTQRTDAARLVAALGAVAAGLTVVDFNLVPQAIEGEGGSLTAREREVLGLLVAGCSNRRIARRLGISEHTAKFHVNGILVKLSAGTRTEAVVKAARQGLVML